MTPLTWALAGWLGALAYVMVGALIFRLVPERLKVHDGLYCKSGCVWDPSICGFCHWQMLAAIWPVTVTVVVALHVVRALVYIPFRAAARAIAKPQEEA